MNQQNKIPIPNYSSFKIITLYVIDIKYDVQYVSPNVVIFFSNIRLQVKMRDKNLKFRQRFAQSCQKQANKETTKLFYEQGV